MEIIIHLLVGLHVIGIAALLGGVLAQTKAMRAGEARMTPGMLYGALTMLVTGVALIATQYADGVDPLHVKLTIKMIVLLVILGLVYVKRDEERLSAGLFGTVGGLTTANIFIAVLWT